MTTFGPLAFAAPWILVGLVALPVIWWLLRVTPPAPKKVQFPAVRLLLGLPQSEETPAHTPFWLLLLRMVIAGLIIVGLADPFLNPSAHTKTRSAVVIVVDNGWAAAARWDDRVGAMQTIAAEAERDGRPLVVVPTAMTDAAIALKLLAGSEAQGAIKAVAPQPFGVDRSKAADSLEKLHLEGTPDIVWLTDGLDDGHAGSFSEELSKLGKLRVMSDEAVNAALALTPPRTENGVLVFRAVRAKGAGEIKATLRATGSQGRFLAAQQFTIPDGDTEADIKLDLATELRNDLARVEIADRQSAGSISLIDERWRRRPVGLVSGENVDTAQPLLSDLFYLRRALSPYAELHEGRIGELLKSGLSVLMLADVGQIVGDDKRAAADWVDRGGVLVRFSGPKLAAQVDDLIPGKLRSGGRLLGGALSWDAPQPLSAIPEDSPFFGLSIPNDVTVNRQVLTEPGTGTALKTWARLADGTPLVTAEQRGKGWVVLFHVTANTSWSSLPISGLFVEMLRRIVALSAGISDQHANIETAKGPLAPIETLDGFGRLGAPAAAALPLRSGDFDTAMPGPQHPPGFYGEGGVRRAYNLFKPDLKLRPLPPLPSGVPISAFGLQQAVELKYVIIALAILLALVDVVAGLVLRGLIGMPRIPARVGGTASIVVVCLAATLVAASVAHADDAFALKASLEYRLAYVITGDPEVDNMSRAGLKGLSRVLKERTAVEPGDPIAVDVEKDELAFFPLLYWPMSPAQPKLSPQALAKIDSFMRHGGTILFDTRDHETDLPTATGRSSSGTMTLRRLLAGLDLPPLQQLTPEHVLTKSFYLLREFPGRWAGGKVWVEAQQVAADGTVAATSSSGDGVSPIIVGSADWAAAWAQDDYGRPLAAVAPGGNQQREYALRFGVNVVMYTLTGNYKTDQVHVPAILERLGQ
ncbi:MAG: DUF4159 domain-containing protein [Alphaproteobacteria bacterium]|nr:DUF4159 domain-containing protein [Alphaproteobacteria bacterium]